MNTKLHHHMTEVNLKSKPHFRLDSSVGITHLIQIIILSLILTVLALTSAATPASARASNAAVEVPRLAGPSSSINWSGLYWHHHHHPTTNYSYNTEATLAPNPFYLTDEVIAAIPEELRSRSQWVVWRYRTEPGRNKPSKVPLRHDGTAASVSDPATWLPFLVAQGAYLTGGFDGIGFVFTAVDPYAGIDLDDAIDPVTGALNATAAAIIDSISSYTEFSVSGKGVHAIVRAKLTKPGSRGAISTPAGESFGVEIYDSARFFVVTGCLYRPDLNEICDRQPQVDELHQRLFPVPATQATPTPVTPAPQNLPAVLTAGDRAIIDRAMALKPRFADLWSGLDLGYHSPSEADLAMCNMLARLVKRDPARVDRLFRASSRMRPKWDEVHSQEGRSYGEMTVAKACQPRVTTSSSSQTNTTSVPVIRCQYGPGTLTAMLNKAESALLGAQLKIYQRSGELVTIAEGIAASESELAIHWPDRGPRIVELSRSLLLEHLDNVARWVRGSGEKRTNCRPPSEVVSGLLARGTWRFPALYGIADVPLLLPNGDLSVTSGYSATTQIALHLDPSINWPVSPAPPDQEDAEESLKQLADVFHDFPFVDESHWMAAVAALITPLVRYAFEGPAPLFAFDANIAAAGKSLATSVCCVVATGDRAPVMSPTDSDAEERKRITSLARSGARIIVIDNITNGLGSAALDAALTSTTWQDRLLVTNVPWIGPLLATWYATGNNLHYNGDTSRRVLPIRMESEHEYPDAVARTFLHDPLIPWVRQNRPVLVMHAITVVRAYLLHGAPPIPGIVTIGSFEGWSNTVRNAIIWAGGADPAMGRLEIRSAVDPVLSAMRVVLNCWHDHFGTHPTTLRQLADLLPDSPTAAALRDALAELAPVTRRSPTGTDPTWDPVRLRYLFRANNRRNIGGLRVVTGTPARGGAMTWSVTPVTPTTTVA